MICISIAHSSKARGASNDVLHLTEYEVSKIASYACFDVLRNNGYPVTLMDCGSLNDVEYSIYKTKLINSMIPEPELSMEIHLNGSTDKNACYGEVLYKTGIKSFLSKTAADCISDAINYGFTKSLHPLRFKNHGSQTSDRHLFFLDKINCPSIIVEGLFISNDEHAAWLKDNGAQAYGVLVANGLLKWLHDGD